MSDLTFGQQAVGLTFNPSGDQTVTDLKQHYADVIDTLNTLRENTTDKEELRLLSIAITEAQGAQMWAVKAVTWSKGKTDTAQTHADSAPADSDGDSDTEAGTTGAEAPSAPADQAAPATGTPAAAASDPAPTQPNVGSTPSA